MNRGAWLATVHGVTKSQTQLGDSHSLTYWFGDTRHLRAKVFCNWLNFHPLMSLWPSQVFVGFSPSFMWVKKGWGSWNLGKALCPGLRFYKILIKSFHVKHRLLLQRVKGMAIHSSIFAWRIPWTEETVLGVAKSQTQLSDFHFTSCSQNNSQWLLFLLPSTEHEGKFLGFSYWDSDAVSVGRTH